MCGIFASISTQAPSDIPSQDTDRCLQFRGPDHVSTVHARIDRDGADAATAAPVQLTLTSTVLSLRGDHVTEQPIVHETTGSVLCWNGEAWRIGGRPVEGNDGEVILARLADASAAGGDPCHVVDALRAIEGPFAFVYLDKPAGRLFYGRDRLGRRSLLRKRVDAMLSLSSVAGSPASGWQEVEADGCYMLDLTHYSPKTPARYDWSEDTTWISSIASFNEQVPDGDVELTAQAPSVGGLHRELLESLRPRVLNVPVPRGALPTDARVAVLFSGGIDCTMLARLASDLIPPDQIIDLLNVAFENPRIAAQYKTEPVPNLYELCPDRITGRRSFTELSAACPQRNWRLVTVDVPYELCTAHRAEVIRLIYPHNTEMDMSIAYALYFAARGRGSSQTHTQPEPNAYQTTARVLLSGLGADELFGGYVRHSTAFSRRGYQGLIDELKLDVGRLGKRNLGRDDRAMSHWGREVRFPFLDERFVKWAMELPVWEKCDFGSSDIVSGLDPEKRILRLLADTLGMGGVAREKKRAIQFGARTAKMESGKVKGTTLITP